jgi:hypothetical protein
MIRLPFPPAPHLPSVSSTGTQEDWKREATCSCDCCSHWLLLLMLLLLWLLPQLLLTWLQYIFVPSSGYRKFRKELSRREDEQAKGRLQHLLLRHCERHRWQMKKTFKQKNFNNFVWTPLGSRVNIYINFCLQVQFKVSAAWYCSHYLPPVSLTPVANLSPVLLIPVAICHRRPWHQ